MIEYFKFAWVHYFVFFLFMILLLLFVLLFCGNKSENSKPKEIDKYSDEIGEAILLIIGTSFFITVFTTIAAYMHYTK